MFERVVRIVIRMGDNQHEDKVLHQAMNLVDAAVSNEINIDFSYAREENYEDVKEGADTELLADWEQELILSTDNAKYIEIRDAMRRAGASDTLIAHTLYMLPPN